MIQFSNLQHLWWLIPAVIILLTGFYFSLVERPASKKWLSLSLRIAAVVSLILALCRPFQSADAEDTHFIFLIDGSASISAAGINLAVDQVKEGIEDLDPGDSYSLMLFSDTCQQTTLENLTKLAKQIETDGADADLRAATNLSNALLISRMEFRADKAKKMVVFSDGFITEQGVGNVLKTFNLEKISTDFIKIPSIDKKEIAVTEFKSLTPNAYEGEIVRFEGSILANHSMKATARLLHRGVEIQTQDLSFEKGKSAKVGFDVEMFSAGNTRWSIEIQPEHDYFPMNNMASTSVQVSGKPRVLAIHQKPLEMRPLARALRKQGIELDVRGAKGLPSSLSEMLSFRAILLCDVPATDLTVPQMFDLKSYVADMGGGLGMLGSENSFGIGGYHNTPVDEVLPIASRYEKEKIKPSLGMVLVIDKSGSMQGQPIELARQAAKSAVELLGGQDSIAVVGFDGNAQTIVEMSSAASKEAIYDSIDSLAAGGGTNLYPGMVRAKEMLDTTPAKIKHMIILSDGQTGGEGYEALCEELVSSKVTISTVALGEGAAKELMQALATIGKGRYYETNDPQSVPQIFTKETMQASKSAIKEDLFSTVVNAEHPMLNGFEKAELPFILGYVMTQPKALAKVVLTTETGDPLLATQRFGLGQTFAYTSDLTEKWGSEWLAWSAGPQFWNQAIRSILRKEDGRGISYTSSITNDILTLNVTRRDDSGKLVNQVNWNAASLDDQKKVTPISLSQTGVGTYTTKIPLTGIKRLTVQIRDTADGRLCTHSWNRPYPAEFQLNSTLPEALSQVEKSDLSSLTMGVDQSVVEKDRQSWFAYLAIVLAIGSIVTRRI